MTIISGLPVNSPSDFEAWAEDFEEREGLIREMLAGEGEEQAEPDNEPADIDTDMGFDPYAGGPEMDEPLDAGDYYDC